MSKGDIVLIPFPFTDLSGQKMRPALVLHNEKKGEDCIVSFISTVASRKVGRFDIPVSPTVSNGIKSESVIKINKIATLQKKLVLGKLGMLEKSSLVIVDKLLRDLFNI
jgi:mRNA interferase MazF